MIDVCRLYYLRGLSYYQMKRYKDSIKDLKQSLRLQRTSNFAHDWYFFKEEFTIFSYFHIGIAYCNLKKHIQAVAAFTNAIACRKDNEIPMYYHERAKAFQHLQQYEEVTF